MAASTWSASGLMQLSTPELGALDAMIQRDINAARQGDAVAFAGTFTGRRSAEERQRAGLDRLSDTQRATLDQAVATAIATRPNPPIAIAAPRPAPVLSRSTTTWRPEVHGEVSLFVGGGSGGRSWYGGSFDAVVADPEHGLAVAVGVAEIRGKGLPCPYWYW